MLLKATVSLIKYVYAYMLHNLMIIFLCRSIIIVITI